MNENTLEPPGTIAILGGGPLALEAAIYGRYLGYSVTVFVTEQTVVKLRCCPEASAPRLCATPLGLAALAAQRGLGGTSIDLDIRTIGDWIQQYLDPLADVDLLRGRVLMERQITSIEYAIDSADEVEPGETEANELSDDDLELDMEDFIPPDFQLNFTDSEGVTLQGRFEALIDARMEQGEPRPVWLGPGSGPQEFPSPNLPDYYLVLEELNVTSVTEQVMADGFERVRRIFGELSGRPDLDVYRNLGGF